MTTLHLNGAEAHAAFLTRFSAMTVSSRSFDDERSRFLIIMMRDAPK